MKGYAKLTVSKNHDGAWCVHETGAFPSIVCSFNNANVPDSENERLAQIVCDHLNSLDDRMTVHIRFSMDKENGEGIAIGNAEIWANKCETDTEKVLSQFIAYQVKNVIDSMTAFAQHLFNPPKSKEEGGAQ